MWKKIIIINILVFFVALVPKQVVQAQLDSRLQNAQNFPFEDTLLTEDTYYRYTARETIELSIETSNIVKGHPGVTVYDSEGRQIFEDGTGWYVENLNLCIPMQRGTTYYFLFDSVSGTNFEYTLSAGTMETKTIQDITVLDNPCLTGYDELHYNTTRYGEMYPYFMQDMRILVQYQNGSSETVRYKDDSDIVEWMFHNDLVYEDEQYYIYVYYCGYPIKIEYNMKTIEDISLKQVKEKEAIALSSNHVDWGGYSFTPTETGYYEVSYSLIGDYFYAILNDEKEIVSSSHIGDTWKQCFSENDKIEYIYMVEGHTYNLYIGAYTQRASGKMQFRRNTIQQKYEEITVEPPQSVSYTGTAQEPKPVIKYKGTDVTELGWYVDYNYLYNVEPGVALIEMTCFTDGTFNYGIYDYRLYTSFIIRKPLEKATVTIPDCSYMGSAIVPKVEVTLDGKTLKEGTDYTVKAKNNVDVGTATATITGIGKYEGSIEKTFAIQPVSWTLEVEDSFIKHKKSKAFALKAKSETTLTYVSSDEKVAKVDVDGKVKVKKYGAAIITVIAPADKNHLETKKTVKIVVTSKAGKVKSIKKLSKGKATVKLQKVTGAHGYEVTYSTDKTFQSGVKKVTTKKPTATIKKLKKKTKYYVRVRSYRKVNGKKLYSDYSKVKSYRY